MKSTNDVDENETIIEINEQTPEKSLDRSYQKKLSI